MFKFTRHLVVVTVLAGLGMQTVHAAVDNKCVKDCTRRGINYQHCVADCSYGPRDDLRSPPAAQFLPVPEPLPPTLPKAKIGAGTDPGLPPVMLDGRCLKDCRNEGYSSGLCKRRCTY